MALVEVTGLSFEYPEATAPALRDVSLSIEEGERVAVLGPSGAGKSSLLRALSGLVPHFHGGRFSGRVTIAGLDTRRTRPAELARFVGTVFQDPEDQVVMTRVVNEVVFGLENLGVSPTCILPRAEQALEALGVAHLADRRTGELSGGELQRVCLAAVLACRPRVLVLDEPTSQLDPHAAAALLDGLDETGAAIVLSEQRTSRALAFADRVLFVEDGALLLDAATEEAIAWLAQHRPRYAGLEGCVAAASAPSDPVVKIDNGWFSYAEFPVLCGTSLEVRRGEVVALEGANGSGKTTLAKVACGLLSLQGGGVERRGRTGYVAQDPGRYLLCERVLDEVALAVEGDRARAAAELRRVDLAWAENRHPRDLSSGERERLAVAAVAVAEPDLLVLDEPTRGLDPDGKAELADRLHRYASAGRGVLVVTHDRDFPAHRRVSLARERVLVAA